MSFSDYIVFADASGDLAAIRQDMLTDPFLSKIVPRWPGTETRLHGYRTGLDSSERYS